MALPNIAPSAPATNAPADISAADAWKMAIAETGGIQEEAETEEEVEPPKPAPKVAKAPERVAEPAKPKENEGTVQVTERARFREEKRAFYAARDKEKGEFQAQIAKERQELSKYSSAHTAAQNGDPDGLAEALGFKNWSELNQEMLASSTSPGYRRLKDLERRARETEENTTKERTAAQERQANETRTRARADWETGLRAELIKADPVLQDLVAEAGFANSAMTIQEQEYDGSGTISHTEAGERALKHLLDVHGKISGILEKHANSPLLQKLMGNRPPRTVAQAPRKAPNSVKTLSQNNAADASTSSLDDGEAIKRKFARQLAQDIKAEYGRPDE